MTRGTKLINRGSFAQAAEAFFSATQLRWTFTEAHIELGNAYSALKQYDKALDAYTNAIENDPTSIIAHYNIALTFTDLTQLNTALHWLQCVIQIDPKYQIAYIPLARSLLTTAQPKKAVTQLLFAAKLSKPHHPDLLVQAGKVYEQLKFEGNKTPKIETRYGMRLSCHGGSS